MDYVQYAKVMKALSEPNRVKILDMLSCGSMCACDVLEHFEFTQPTLSHHIKVLVEAGLVTTDKKGTWHHYSVNEEKVKQLVTDTMNLFSSSDRCVCVIEKGEEGKRNEEVSPL